MPISLRSSRKDLVERSLSRISVSLCWTNGCSTTVTPSMGFPNACALLENRAVAHDSHGRRAAGPPFSPVQDVEKGEGAPPPANLLAHFFREPIEQSHRERTPFDDKRRGHV